MSIYYKQTNPAIVVTLDDRALQAVGIDLDITGSTLTTELEADNGDYLKFLNAKHTVNGPLEFEIQPDDDDVRAMQIGRATLRTLIDTGSGKYGIEVASAFEVRNLINS